MRIVFVAVMLAICSNAFAATAFFTGNQEIVQSVTGRVVWNCQYNYAGRLFWRAFSVACPSQIEIE